MSLHMNIIDHQNIYMAYSNFTSMLLLLHNLYFYLEIPMLHKSYPRNQFVLYR